MHVMGTQSCKYRSAQNSPVCVHYTPMHYQALPGTADHFSTHVQYMYAYVHTVVMQTLWKSLDSLLTL